MEYKRKDNLIELIFLASNAGKFRFKKRSKNIDFGKTFSTREEVFDDSAYLEWQIGYDAIVKDVENGNKQTRLTQETFIGDNGKEKYPYELSEILYESIKGELISLNEIDDLSKEISDYTDFIDEKEIVVEEHSKLSLNGISFTETSIKLPTLFMPQNSDGTQIEISIQKQQYASGVQPMIYFCIPFDSFTDAGILRGNSSKKGDTLTYIVRKENIEVILNLFKVFGMASRRHKFDVEQILKTIKKIVKNH